MDLWVVVILAGALVAAAIGLVRKHLLPRRYGARLVDAICAELGFTRLGVAPGSTLRGEFYGRPVELDVSPVGYAVVTAKVSEAAVPADLRVYETSSWSYQKAENRMLGLTVDTGDLEFDVWFDVNGNDRQAALRLPERTRRVLVAHRRRGLMILDGTVMLGSGSAAPFGYVYQRPDTLDGVKDMLTAVVALARELDAGVVS